MQTTVVPPRPTGSAPVVPLATLLFVQVAG